MPESLNKLDAVRLNDLDRHGDNSLLHSIIEKIRDEEGSLSSDQIAAISKHFKNATEFIDPTDNNKDEILSTIKKSMDFSPMKSDARISRKSDAPKTDPEASITGSHFSG